MLLKKGSRWRVSDGRSINFWNDPWLRDQANMKVETPMMEDFSNLIVSDLFMPGTKRWNVDLLKEIFHECDVMAICSIPCTIDRGLMFGFGSLVPMAYTR